MAFGMVPYAYYIQLHKVCTPFYDNFQWSLFAAKQNS